MEISDTERASQAIAAYEHSLAEFITAWNRVEASYRALLIAICGKTPAAYILTAGLGSRGLGEALRSYAADGMTDPHLSAVKHAVEFYNRVLGFRNYYVHGIQRIAYSAHARVAVGEVQAVSSKGRFVLHDELISQAEIEAARSMTIRLHHALLELLQCFDPGAPEPTPPADRLEEFRVNNPWPDNLSKPRNYLLQNHFRDPMPPQE